MASDTAGGAVLVALRASSTDLLRQLVSKKKTRWHADGFDLDLAYVTPRLIAMGFPSSGTEALYRNPAAQVRAFLRHYHDAHAKVYNLCAERTYPPAAIGLDAPLVEHFPSHDHNPCPLFCLPPFCRSVEAWLAADARNVAAVHCKAGKGRTGMLLCAFLVWSRECADADAALRLFGERRTRNGKGVTIPSQRRYVRYLEELLSRRDLERALNAPPLLFLHSLQLLHAPEWACTPATYFTVELVHRQGGGAEPAMAAPRWRSWRVYDHREAGGGEPSARRRVSISLLASSIGMSRRASSSPTRAREALAKSSPAAMGRSGGRGSPAPCVAEHTLACPATDRLPVAGDVKVTIHTARGKLAAFWFHSAFVQDGALHLPKAELDKACKDKKGQLPPDFGVTVNFDAAATPMDESSIRALLDQRAASLRTPQPEPNDDEEDEDQDDEDDEGGSPGSPQPDAHSPGRM